MRDTGYWICKNPQYKRKRKPGRLPFAEKRGSGISLLYFDGITALFVYMIY
jgi:hypothetical protein